jgi:preprotein translocase subunit SecF
MRPLKLVPDNTNVPFLSYRWWALGISILLLVASVALVAVRGLNLGVDFVGGQMFRVHFSQPANVDDLRTRIGGLGLGEAAIQQFGSDKDVSIRMQLPKGGEDAANAAAGKVRAAVRARYPDVKFENVETVSGKVSEELLKTGTLAMTLAMLGITLFIWFRFEWQFGVGALVTLFHDVIITFGFFALTRLEFNLNVVAAVLTIIGYSLNDTIIVYDRIRENLKKWRKMDVESLLNLSVNETLSRTLVTSLSMILTLSVLLLVGPEVSFGFTAAMLLGIVIGTFSSIYISAPVLIWLNVKSDSFVPAEAGTGSAERIARSEGFVK